MVLELKEEKRRCKECRKTYVINRLISDNDGYCDECYIKYLEREGEEIDDVGRQIGMIIGK